MKVFLLIVGLFFALGLTAQTGHICQIDTSMTQPGLYPSPDSLPCFVRNCFCNNVVVQFVNFDSTTISGIRVRVDYIIIDSILNLPCGINWATSNEYATTLNRFDNQEKGCILFYGLTSDDVGQYRLKIKVKAKVSLLPNEVPYEAEALGFRVDVRLKNSPTETCPDIDTTNNAILKTASCKSRNYYPLVFDIPPPLCDQFYCDTVGINEIASINSFSFYPNPTSNNATVSFTADKAASYTTRIVNIYGQEVSRWQLQVQQGTNTHPIDISALAAGVYFFTITDGKNVTSQRFVIE